MFSVSPEDDWDDVMFPDTTAALSRKHRGIFMVNDDLAGACVRLLSPPTLPDDASSSSSSFVSNHSKLFVDEEWDNRSRGRITRLDRRQSNFSRTSSDDLEWEGDIQLPARLERPQPRSQPDACLDTLEGSYRKTVTFQQQHNGSHQNSPGNSGSADDNDDAHEDAHEDDHEDDNFNDIDFPDDMRTLSTRRERKLARSAIARRHNTRAAEEEDDNLCDGLDVANDDVFQVSRSARKQTTRLPRPTKAPLPERRVTPAGPSALPFASGSRRPDPCMPPPPKPFFRTAVSGPEPRRPRGLARATLLSQPKSGPVFGSGQELDGFDNLPEWKGLKQRHQQSQWRTHQRLNTHGDNEPAHNGPSLRQPPKKKPDPTVDPLRPWRTNMRMPTLIRPDDKPVIQVRSRDMNYDPKHCRWQGNERSVARFDHEPPCPSTTHTRRPALIRHKAKSPGRSSKYAEVVVGNMVFNMAEMRWVKQADPGSSTLPDRNAGVTVLDTIEDLPIDERQIYRSLSSTGRGPRPGQREFKVSPDVARQMVDDEKAHDAMMKRWCLSGEEPVIKRPGHGWMPSYAYLMTHPRR